MFFTSYYASLGKLHVCYQLRHYWVTPLRWVGINLKIAYACKRLCKYNTPCIYSYRMLQMFPDVLWRKWRPKKTNMTDQKKEKKKITEEKRLTKKKNISRENDFKENKIFQTCQSYKCNSSRSTEDNLCLKHNIGRPVYIFDILTAFWHTHVWDLNWERINYF